MTTKKTFWMGGLLSLVLSLALPAQAGEPAGSAGGDKPVAGASATKKPRIAISDAGRAALAAAKEIAGKVRGLRGPERMQALEAAASAYDKVVAEHAAEPAVASVAAITAADLWRQQGSVALAEKDYLLAVQLDGERFAQRGLLGAADMQRRQQRRDDAMATYKKAAEVDPASARAQDARLWQARLLQQAERVDEAIVAFQAALESADPGNETVEACNFLALAWIQKGDHDAAAKAIEHAENAVQAVGDDDPIVVERLKKAIETMSAKRALQRARDKAANAQKDAVGLDRARHDG